jgi:hypothetical protein
MGWQIGFADLQRCRQLCGNPVELKSFAKICRLAWENLQISCAIPPL